MKKTLNFLRRSLGISLFLLFIIPFCTPVQCESIMDETVSRMGKLCETPDFRIYYEAKTENRCFYGAKFEPGSGVYHGTPHDVSYSSIPNTIDTEYFWFDSTLTNDVCERAEISEYAERSGKFRLYNWNCALKDEVIEPADYENYIKNTVDNIASDGNDSLLVSGKEFNINDNFTHPESFIKLFRYVADYAHTKDNIAVVWAPNNVGSVDLRLIDFYPGDEYTDWIGMSLYVMPYFQGSKAQTTWSNSVSFVAGDYSNAVIGAKVITDFMETYNIKKPVVITEGGVGYGEMPGREDYINGFEYVDWAAQQLRKFYYEIPRVFPQIKINVSFNHNVDLDFYRYNMSDSPELYSIVNSAVSTPPYIQGYPGFSPVEYPEMHDIEVKDSLKLSAYAYEPKALYLNVKYLIDGVSLYETMYPPYEFTLDSSNLSEGTHTLTVEKYSSSQKLDSKDFKITYNSKDSNQTVNYPEVPVFINGEELISDQPAFIIHDRTMVPMRAIFETLGAEVIWDETNETVTAKKNGTEISLKINDNKMTKNGWEIELDAPAILLSDHTMLPLRAVSEAFGAAVTWDEQNRIVNIEFI